MVNIRSAVRPDLPTVAALWETDGGPSRSSSGLAEAERLFTHDPNAIQVADDGGDLVGTLVVGWDGWRCHLYRLAVPERSRRRGIGSALLDAAINRARALGVDRLDAMVHRANEPAVAFWEAAGFGRDDEDCRWSLLIGQP